MPTILPSKPCLSCCDSEHSEKTPRRNISGGTQFNWFQIWILSSFLAISILRLKKEAHFELVLALIGLGVIGTGEST